MTPDIKALALLARRYLRRGIRRTDAVGAELRRIDPLIARAETAEPPAAPTHHPVIRHLGAALEGFRDLDALAESGPLLPWRHGYQPDPSRPGLEDRLARVELIGPEAPLRYPGLCLGFVLIAPHTVYPPHAHPAAELYHIISGRALWSVGETAAPRRAADFVLHPSGIPHATATADEPLLTIYTWTGDVLSPSRFLPERSP
nr:dimethylsulfonioproprionate lyase family protein [uncultured Rhodopila sp.]